MSPNGGHQNGILVALIKFVKKEKTNRESLIHDRLFGATKIPFGGPPFGDTQNPREINFYRNGLLCYALYIIFV